ncbi:MAG: type II secretion system F family protein [Candidatus Omnitrophica bacterium]|nr:type II secretion system F family protein [Candidatus Omnitrophota bacterium]
MIFLLIVLLIIGSVILLVLAGAPLLFQVINTWMRRKEKTVARQLDRMFYEKNPKEILRLYFILPPILGLAGYFIFRSFLLFFLGIFLGLFIPNLILKIRDSQRRVKFNSQILDAIMILSSSLKGGLSFLQALEVLAEEMPQPMSQEIGMIVRENKMGVSLEESLKSLNQRMPSEDLNLLISSLLVARETGGDFTKVLSRLSTTIRDNRKLKENVRTLTLQGRMQGIIMSVLPFLFVWWVVNFNRHHFDIMFQSDIGRMLLVLAVILQIVGMFLIRTFSTIRI